LYPLRFESATEPVQSTWTYERVMKPRGWITPDADIGWHGVNPA